MAMHVIPMADAAELGAFYFTVELEGKDYQFNFQYNARDGFWYFDVLDTEGNQIRSGVRVVANFPLTRLAVMTTSPPGELLCIDTRSDPSDPGLADLGVDVEFVYVEEDQWV